MLPYKVSEKDHTPWTYEPHVAARVTRQMLAEAEVRVLTGRPLKSVAVHGSRISDLVTTAGETFQARVFIDATYEGDLMAAAGVRWTIGREGRDEYGESLAGKRYSKPVMPISGYDDRGRMLPLITTDSGGPEEEGDRNVMVYSFRLCLTQDPENRVPFPAPAHYDPAASRSCAATSPGKNAPCSSGTSTRSPDGKFDANNGIGKQFSMGLVGGGNGWCEADAEGRARIREAHKQYILEMYHFLTTDPAVPEDLRDQLASYGLCRDEFPDSGHWSPQLYVREGRRMRGMYVLTQHDVLTDRTKPDPIAISSFPIDSHDCQRIARKDGGVLNEGTIFPVREPGRRHGYACAGPVSRHPAEAGGMHQPPGAGGPVRLARRVLVDPRRAHLDDARSQCGDRRRPGGAAGPRRATPPLSGPARAAPEPATDPRSARPARTPGAAGASRQYRPRQTPVRGHRVVRGGGARRAVPDRAPVGSLRHAEPPRTGPSRP